MPTVLVVDDEATVRELAARMLRHAGYATVEAPDGRDAWTYLHRPGVLVDAIVADVVMPRMTGTELVALVRENRPDLPILLMSAYSAADLKARGLAEYPVPLLTKPFTHGDLVALVNQLLSNGHSRAG